MLLLSVTITIDDREEPLVLIEKIENLGWRLFTLGPGCSPKKYEIKITKSVRQVNFLKKF